MIPGVTYESLSKFQTGSQSITISVLCGRDQSFSGAGAAGVLQVQLSALRADFHLVFLETMRYQGSRFHLLSLFSLINRLLSSAKNVIPAMSAKPCLTAVS